METGKIIFMSLVCLFFASAGMSEDISWINGLDKPAGWTIDPCDPGQNDTISFSGPVGPLTSSCFAMMYLGGTPRLTIDQTNKIVELWFEGPAPENCPLIWAPVCGLTGQLGPLTPGYWTFKSIQSAIAFEVQFTVAQSAKTYYVDKDAPGSVHNGKSWKWAFTNLQDALAVAISGDTILVAQGTYKPDQGGSITTGAREASFSPAAGVKLIGSCAGFGNADPDHQDLNTYTTVLSGDLNSNDSGTLNKSDNSYRIVSVSGGMSGKTIINGFIITAGQADGPDPFNSGAGLFVDNSDLMLVNTTISGNVSGLGGGIACRNAKLSMWNCIIIGNNARIYGGGLNSYASDVDMINCLMTGNVSLLAATSGSSAIYNLGGNLTILDCTIADNFVTPTADGKAITSYLWKIPSDSNLVIANSILYNGGNEILTNHSDTVTVSYSDVQGGWTGTGNNNKNPQFVNAGHRDGSGQWINGDYSLKSNSPCLDKGSNSLLPLDSPDIDKDGNTSEQLPKDLAGAARIQNSIVDMGAFERAGATPPPQGVPYLQDYVWFNIPSPVPGSPILVQSGVATYEVCVDVPSIITLGIVPTTGIPGTWTATFTTNPGVVGPGCVFVSLTVRGENVDVSQLSSGWNQLAVMTIYTQPAIE